MSKLKPDDANEEPLPQPMSHAPTPPSEIPVASPRRQEKIDRLRSVEDTYEEYDDDLPPPRKGHKVLRFFGWMLLIVVLTAAGAAGVWYFWLSKEEAAKQAAKPAQQAQTAPAVTKEEAEPTKTYDSTAFGLHFAYPEDWKVTEGADNKIVAVSPAGKLKVVSGQTQTGQTVLTVQRKQASLPAFAKGDAQAVHESEKIAYAKPSQSQRAETYLSFLGYVESTAKGIDGIHVTGDNGYLKDQLVPMTDIAKSDPLITITFRKCDAASGDAQCQKAGQPMTLAANAWDDAAFSKPLKAMLQSIVVD